MFTCLLNELWQTQVLQRRKKISGEMLQKRYTNQTPLHKKQKIFNVDEVFRQMVLSVYTVEDTLRFGFTLCYNEFTFAFSNFCCFFICSVVGWKQCFTHGLKSKSVLSISFVSAVKCTKLLCNIFCPQVQWEKLD